MPGKSPPMYWAYLLRCWQEESAMTGGRPTWRFSVERILPVDKGSGRGRGEPFDALRTRPKEPSGKGPAEMPEVSDERLRRGFSSLEELVAFVKAQLDREDGAMDGEK